MKILNVGYRSVNCYLLITEKAKLLIDVGWPGGMQELKWSLAAQCISVKEITHVLITHYHMDHGALAQEIKDKGAKLIMMESQVEHLKIAEFSSKLLTWMAKLYLRQAIVQTMLRWSLTTALLLQEICLQRIVRRKDLMSSMIGSDFKQ